MRISDASEWACIIEAGTFKPGNVYPGKKGFLEYVVSAVLLGKSIERICESDHIHLGEFIKEVVYDRVQYVRSNTNLGIIMLFVPIAVAASRGGDLQKMVKELAHETTIEDAVEVAEAVRCSSAFLGEPSQGPDLRSVTVISDIKDGKFTLFDLFSMSSAWDTIASEWVSGFCITFSGAEYLISGGSVMRLYLRILCEYPDSLVQRKFGEEVARNVSREAGDLLKDFSFDDLRKWDDFLYKEGINPGTTADLVASSVFVALLKKEELLYRFLNRFCEGNSMWGSP